VLGYWDNGIRHVSNSKNRMLAGRHEGPEDPHAAGRRD
jgi:hypothetical protein